MIKRNSLKKMLNYGENHRIPIQTLPWSWWYILAIKYQSHLVKTADKELPNVPCSSQNQLCLWGWHWLNDKHTFDSRVELPLILKQLMTSTVKCHYHKMIQHLSQQLLPTFSFSCIPGYVTSRWWGSDCSVRKVVDILWQKTYSHCSSTDKNFKFMSLMEGIPVSVQRLFSYLYI